MATQNWCWACAEKTLTSVTIRIANQEGFIDLINQTNSYLGDMPQVRDDTLAPISFDNDNALWTKINLLIA